jgi:hypothetical protein
MREDWPMELMVRVKSWDLTRSRERTAKHVVVKDVEREVEEDISASSVVSLAPATLTVHGINSSKHSRDAAVKLSLYIPWYSFMSSKIPGHLPAGMMIAITRRRRGSQVEGTKKP